MKLYSTETEVAELCEKLKSEPCIGVDTEFIRETTFFPKLELIQIGTATETFVIDFQKYGTQSTEKFCDLLKNPSVLKIFHSAQADQECFFTSLGVLASPIWDTEVAASLCGQGDSLGLVNVLRNTIGVELKKGHTRTNWSARPLAPYLIEYAHQDVKHLVELYEALNAKLKELGREAWMGKLVEKWTNPETFTSDPEEMAIRLSKSRKMDAHSFSVLMELVKWREEKVRQKNIPRKWLIEDSVLVDLSTVKPKDEKHLKNFRGFHKAEIRGEIDSILKLIQVASQNPIDPPEKRRKFIKLTQAETRALELLKCYMGILADEHQLALKHVLLSENAVELLRNQAKTVEDLKAHRFLSDDIVDLMGEKILNFLNGKSTLGIKNLEVKIYDLPQADDKSTE